MCMCKKCTLITQRQTINAAINTSRRQNSVALADDFIYNLVTLQQSDSSTNKNIKKCARCKNHGDISPLKYHKAYCKHRDCQCRLCSLLGEKQKISAAQIALRRRRQQDEEMVKLGHSTDTTPAPVFPVPVPQPILQNNINTFPIGLEKPHTIAHMPLSAPNPQLRPMDRSMMNAAFTLAPLESMPFPLSQTGVTGPILHQGQEQGGYVSQRATWGTWPSASSPNMSDSYKLWRSW
ncbi:unnamed protein product [Owenia fusiformis]|uniref:DM domain-containing protein n=1 Tax=Owenia fusiformis TaxID=6347 RepID=A0A8S4Q5H7_OWEFU|nr:unnamed protein product [Owenia fusiformis]